MVENCSINVEFLENETGEIQLGYICYLLEKLKMVFCKLGPVLYLSLTVVIYPLFGGMTQQYNYSILIVKSKMTTYRVQLAVAVKLCKICLLQYFSIDYVLSS